MDLELDFLPIGEKTQSGDSIVLRYGNLNGTREEYSVVVIDAGFSENGNQVVDHIAKIYNTSVVDLVISTHPDNDHSGGIPSVLENLKVKKLWMHKPWDHTDNIAKLFKNSFVTDTGVENRLMKSLITAKNIEDIAQKKNIPITEPFTGLRDDFGGLTVLGPDSDFYKTELIPNFKCTPEPANDSILSKIGSKIGELSEAVKEMVDEKWHIETLDESGTTTAENNSSAVIMLNIDNNHVLFTADAGQPALERVLSLLDRIQYDYSRIRLAQVPHHGSHRNINPNILNKIIGQKLETEPSVPLKMAIASVSKELDEKHPSKRVTNAFLRRGAPVHITNGGLKYYYLGNAPRKDLYPASAALPFFDKVETHND